MVFSSMVFIFGFLPITLIGTFIFQRCNKIQNTFLLLMSLLFYAWGEPKYVLLMMLSIALNWCLALGIDADGRKKWQRNILLIIAIVFNVGSLFVFKYLTWGIAIVNSTFGCSVPYRDIALPIGISFYTFQALSYVIDVWRQDVQAKKDMIGVGLYISLFPQLVAGPIVRYGDIEKQLSYRKISLEGFSDGITRFMCGFTKKVLLADNVAVIADKAFAMNKANELGGAFAWLGAVAYTFQIFFDFSGYSDMAIGLGKMLGFSLPENFNFPYKAHSIRDFWRRWHISLSSWFRDYVYIPLGGNRKGNRRTYVNLAIVWLLTGIWHGANITFVLWGAIYGLLIIFERMINIEEKVKNNRVVGVGYRIFTCVCIIILWVLFRAENINQACLYIARMFDWSKWLDNISLVLLYISEYKWELTACVVCSLVKWPNKFQQQSSILETIKMLLLYMFFIISISYLVKGTYSPFIYFNF